MSKVIAEHVDSLPTPISCYNLSRVRKALNRAKSNGMSSNHKAPVDYLDKLKAEDIETLINMVRVLDENACAKRMLPAPEADSPTLEGRPSLKTPESIEGWRQVFKALSVGADTVRVNVTQLDPHGEEKHLTQCIGIPPHAADNWDVVFAIGYDSTESVEKTLRKKQTRNQFLRELEGIDLKSLQPSTA